MQGKSGNSLILIVDDEGDRSSITAFLKTRDYSVCEAVDANEALRIASKESPDLILMSVDIPGMDGFDVCRQLRNNPDTTAIPIVLMAESANADLVDKAYEQGAEEFITKPIYWASLRHRIKRILERKANEELIRHLAYHDPLTNLPNRVLVLDRLEYALARCRRFGGQGAALFLDLDQFKTINDSLGHSAGDELLQAVALRLKEAMRQGDAVARLGGDEFVVLLQDLGQNIETASKNAWSVAEKVRLMLTDPFEIQGQRLFITPSIGISLFPVEGQESADDVLKQADVAMYRVKETGRNAARFFQASMQSVADDRLELSNDLCLALMHNEFKLYMQPQVDGRGKIRGAEALLRWEHPQQGMVLPDKFIPVAEETGQILAMGRWVLQEACRCLKLWEDRPIGFIAVNVSPKQFRQADFISQVRHVLDEYDVDPRRLELEVTEGLLLECIEDAISTMQALRELGIRFSIDDFGTGYSSLMYLKRLPLDKLKIDRSFIRDISNDPNDAAIVETIIAMARHLDLEVVAEGVETDAERAFLLEQECLRFQGYYFYRPMPIESLGKLL